MCSFRIQEADWIIDLTARGSKANFLSHSCNSNCRANDVKIGIRQLISFRAI
jgi:SET domain-containing protein